VARALALDPDNASARRTLATIFARPPTQPPPEVGTEIQDATDVEAKFAARIGAISYPAFICTGFMSFAVGVRSWLGIIPIMVLMAIATAWCIKIALGRFKYIEGVGIYVLSSIAIAMCAGYCGPWVLVPAFCVANTMVYSTGFLRAFRAPILVIGCLVLILPQLLELVGVVAPSFRLTSDGIELLPRFVVLSSNFVPWTILVDHLAVLVVPTLALWRMATVKDDLRRRLLVQTWQMQQLVAGEPGA
jgi:hypothetical protein